MPRSTKTEAKKRKNQIYRAACLLKLAKHGAGMTVSEAMGFVGFEEDDLDDDALRKAIYRKRDRLDDSFVEPPPLVPVTNPDVLDSKKATEKAADGAATAPIMKPIEGKRLRLTGHQAHAKRHEAAAQTHLHNQLHIQACYEWKAEWDKKQAAKLEGKKVKIRSAELICKEINEKHEDVLLKRIAPRTVREYVRDGRCGMKLEKPGEKGKLPKLVFDALCEAAKTYAIISQQDGISAGTSSLRPGLQKKLHAVVASNCDDPPNPRKLFERVQEAVAHEINLGKPNRIEQRRRKWGTYSNINMWWDSLKTLLVELGFAEHVPPCDWEEKGELIFFEGQGRRIANMDESCLSLDDTNNGKGGRPAMGWYSPRLASAPTHAAHKSSWCCTLVAGCFASGEPFPHHFQIPTEAQDQANHGIPLEFIEDMLVTEATYLNKEPQDYSCTYGVNEKGGMNKEQFGEYMMKNVLPLVQNDCADKAGKRVLVLVDGGPGRTNADMLATLRQKGLYLFPSGPPSTTHILQIMDMLFSLFKTRYFENLEKLWEYRLLNHKIEKKTLSRNDVGLLVFGSEHSRRRLEDHTFPLLKNSSEEAFSEARIKHMWSTKLGLYPKFTRAALQNKHVRHEHMVTETGEADTEADPDALFLKAQNDLNEMSCTILDGEGYNSKPLRAALTAFSDTKRKAKVLKPRSRELQDAIANVKVGSGRHFQITGGAALNDNDFFISMHRASKKSELEGLLSDKKKRQEATARGAAACLLIEGSQNKPDDKWTSKELKVLISWKLGRLCPSKFASKPQRLAEWLRIKDKPVQNPMQPWSEEDEEELERLKEAVEDVTLDDTILGKKKKEMQEEAMATIRAMDTPAKRAFFRKALLEDDTSATDECDFDISEADQSEAV